MASRIVLKLHWQILIALVLAVLIGRLTGTDASLFGITFYSIYEFIGTLFLQALKMLIVPLIMSSIITGIAGVGHSGALGRLGGKTLLYYMTTSLIAIMIGLILVNATKPGIVDGMPARDIIGLGEAGSEVLERVEGKGAGDVVDIFLRMVPTNIVAAAAEGKMLGLIFFSLLFGYFMTRISADQSKILVKFWEGIFSVMMRITDWVMMFAPIGVFALVAKVVASTGFAAFEPLLTFFMTVLGALAVHIFVVMPVILRVIARVNPLLHFRACLLYTSDAADDSIRV